MGADDDGAQDIEVERRRESKEFGNKLSRIEATLEGMKEQMPVRFEEIKAQITERFKSVDNWQSDREDECKALAEDVIKIRIEQGKQGVKITAGSVIASTIMAAIVAGVMAYFTRK